MKIAIIGTGIAGNTIAYHLNKEHDITVYEQNSHIGGHTHTHQIEDSNGTELNIDTGFIVLNDRTYPNFNKLLDELNVDITPTEMSFSIKCDKTGLEYNGNNLNSMFAQRRNLITPSFYRMIKDILRFNREATDIVVNNTHIDQNITLGRFLSQGNYSNIFIDKYILPMGAAIWSTKLDDMFRFPAAFFFRFFHNHGLLSINNRPQWYVINNGSKSYVERMTSDYKDKIRLNTAVKKIVRDASGVHIHTDHDIEHFDYVFIASHSDQALRMLDHPEDLESSVLSSIKYQRNEAILHTDTKVLPQRKLAWASWNYFIDKYKNNDVTLTYNMNILQGLKSNDTFCVSLNTDAIDDKKVIKRIVYHHPIFTPDSIQAQDKQRDINGTYNTYYCGAYWRNGFHEDGVVSALNALEHFNQDIEREQLFIRRAS